MQSSELPHGEHEEQDQKSGNETPQPHADREQAHSPAYVGDELGESAGIGDPSNSADSELTIDVPALSENPGQPSVSALEMSAVEDPETSAHDEASSSTPDADETADIDGQEPAVDEPSPVVSAASSGELSGSSEMDSAARSFIAADGPASETDFADVAEGGEGADARSVTESVADPWLNAMMATHSRGSRFYSPPDDVPAGDDADEPGFIEEAPSENKPFIGPLRGSDGEDPAEQWMRYYQAVHDAARNPRIYSSDRPIPSEDSLALPLALPVTLRHMTPLVERLIGRAAIEIHQVCEELVKHQIDQFKFELYAEMRALW